MVLLNVIDKENSNFEKLENSIRDSNKSKG